jgi:hypothetical protein
MEDQMRSKEDRDRLLEAFQQHHELGDELRRRVNPITAGEILDLRENPGARIPDKMIGFERVPKLGAPGACDLFRTEDGELAFIAPVEAGVHEFISGSTRVMLPLEHGSSACELIDIVDGDPLWIERPVVGSRPCRLMLDDREIARKPGIEIVTVEDGGYTIIFTHSRSGGMYSIGICHNLNLVSHKTSGRYVVSGFFRNSIEQLCVIYRQASGNGNADAVGVLSDGSIEHYYSGMNILDRVKGSDSMFVACAKDMSYVHVCEIERDRHQLRSKAVVGHLPYLSSCQRLPDYHWAYIGQAAHKQQCWVVSGSGPQPAFNWVSELFEDPEHGLCYWGLIGDALMTMKL